MEKSDFKTPEELKLDMVTTIDKIMPWVSANMPDPAKRAEYNEWIQDWQKRFGEMMDRHPVEQIYLAKSPTLVTDKYEPTKELHGVRFQCGNGNDYIGMAFIFNDVGEIDDWYEPKDNLLAQAKH